MKGNELLVKEYDLNEDNKRKELSLVQETLSVSARTVQDCLIKHVDEPRHKPLITAQVSMTAVVSGLDNWVNDKKYLIPPKDSLLKHYEKTIDALYEFTN